PLLAQPPIWFTPVNPDQYRGVAEAVQQSGGRLVALWGSDDREWDEALTVHAALAFQDGLLCMRLLVKESRPVFPDLSDIFPVANRMQRAVFDLLGLRADKADDERPWLRHAAWPADSFPLRHDFKIEEDVGDAPDNYPFVKVEGEGVHEIPVGPVHAGIIEPGHFRFSVVGERVLRLEERLGYVHKGIEKRFEAMTLEEGVRLAGRVSGDSTVAYSWAYSMAVEMATGTKAPPRADWLRALLLERERVMNHLGDLGYLGNDAALAFGLAQFSRLKEDMLRLNHAHFGHRYLMDCIVPGGVVRDIDAPCAAAIRLEIEALQRELPVLKVIYDDHAGLQDRFLTTGRVPPPLAAKLGLTGLPGRASGQAWDLRVQFPSVPYDQLNVYMATHRNGDVAARVSVRFDEIAESLRLIGQILDDIPGGEIRAPVNPAGEGQYGIGWVESWRGEVLVALETAEGNGISRCHPHDPSWQNWPLLEYAVIGNIVPDFPLINKSFNLSYSGQDL
ncbi:MAG TPA: NADH-quinone oxidoreductase subunit C, partial [Burkholderiales bacterium]|nr:NADH-quinone oxidoreductase subunit C [Burkholderiales bacterium]